MIESMTESMGGSWVGDKITWFRSTYSEALDVAINCWVKTLITGSGKSSDYIVVAFGNAIALVSSDADILNKLVAASNNAIVVNIAVVVSSDNAGVPCSRRI